MTIGFMERCARLKKECFEVTAEFVMDISTFDVVYLYKRIELFVFCTFTIYYMISVFSLSENTLIRCKHLCCADEFL